VNAYLAGTNVTDKSLEYLKALTQLEQLSLENTKVTDKGLEELQKALPHCIIAN
jgi:hypothetical protein